MKGRGGVMWSEIYGLIIPRGGIANSESVGEGKQGRDGNY